MDIVLSLMLLIVGVALSGVAAWRYFDINVGGAVERSRALVQTAASAFSGLTLVILACIVLPL